MKDDHTIFDLDDKKHLLQHNHEFLNINLHENNKNVLTGSSHINNNNDRSVYSSSHNYKMNDIDDYKSGSYEGDVVATGKCDGNDWSDDSNDCSCGSDYVLYKEDDDSHVKLIDFGLAKRVVPNEIMNKPNGTPYYIAPEVLKGSYTT